MRKSAAAIVVLCSHVLVFMVANYLFVPGFNKFWFSSRILFVGCCDAHVIDSAYFEPYTIDQEVMRPCLCGHKMVLDHSSSLIISRCHQFRPFYNFRDA
jgi:hypothetical protein